MEPNALFSDTVHQLCINFYAAHHVPVIAYMATVVLLDHQTRRVFHHIAPQSCHTIMKPNAQDMVTFLLLTWLIPRYTRRHGKVELHSWEISYMTMSGARLTKEGTEGEIRIYTIHMSC